MAADEGPRVKSRVDQGIHAEGECHGTGEGDHGHQEDSGDHDISDDEDDENHAEAC